MTKKKNNRHQKKGSVSHDDEVEHQEQTTTTTDEQPIKDDEKVVVENDEPNTVEKSEEEKEIKQEEKEDEKVDEKEQVNKEEEKVEQQNQEDKQEQQEEDKPKKRETVIIKRKKVVRVKKPKREKPVQPPKVEPAPVQQSGGWGGWFSSIGNAVSSTITSIAGVDEDDEESEEEIVVEEDVEIDKEQYDAMMKARDDSDDDTEASILNAIDNGVFKTADIIADSFMFASNLLTTGFKTVQENANLENVKGLANDISTMSIETKNKATNSEIYEKSQKIASSMVDSSVNTLEAVGQRAYSMFSTQMKNTKSPGLSSNNGGNSNSTTTATTTTNTSTDSLSRSGEIKSSPSSSTSSSLKNSLGEDSNNSNFDLNVSIFNDDGLFDQSKCLEHFNITQYTQDIEKISVESTMKIHQLNRKLVNGSAHKSSIESVLSEIRQLFENDESNYTGTIGKMKLFNNANAFELEKKYNIFFDLLQQYIPTTLKNKPGSMEITLCRGLEFIYQLTGLGLELIESIAQSTPNEKLQLDDCDINEIKEWAIEKSNEFIFLLNKISQDIQIISSMLNEIIKSKQTPNIRKLLNNLSVETTNATSFVQDTKGGLSNICQIMYLNEIKSTIKSPSSPNTPKK
ncbi:hypothetical protein CYY_000668 [Polysphondylium violaceum]|uniref:Uncharacterized protein n=1 Tax=Polysphondylium violaceum TaxID=133409 RepID=A0A8J4V278_9MYCE|nr:hypothetical protein CYY_000668 [Polysphondylium violaceum]